MQSSRRSTPSQLASIQPAKKAEPSGPCGLMPWDRQADRLVLDLAELLGIELGAFVIDLGWGARADQGPHGRIGSDDR